MTLLFVSLGAGVSAQTIGTNFTGVTFSLENSHGEFVAPPDTMGAVGPNHVVEMVNGAFMVYNKAGVQVSPFQSDIQFWNAAGISTAITNANISDPHIVYDPGSGRWFASQINVSSTGNQMLIARSNSSDPTAGFKAVSFTGNVGFADYPAISVDADAVYVSTNNFASDVGMFTGVSLFSMPKADLLLSTPSVANKTGFENLNVNTYGFTLQAALNRGGSIGHGSVVSIDGVSNAVLDRFNVNNPGGAGATLSGVTYVNVLPTPDPPQAGQPDGSFQIDSLDSRISGQVISQGGKLFLIHSLTVGGRSGLRWTVLNEGTNAVVSEGTISNPNFDYFQGSIDINSNNDVVIGFNRSSTSAGDFAGAFARVGKFNGTSIVFGTDITLQPGLDNYHLISGFGERWGDFSAVRLDPSDPTSFWAFQEFAGTNNNWSTQITQIKIDSQQGVPEPGAVTLLGAGLMAGVLFARKQRKQ
ncbi:MAG: PEP-CTERM sorting domain-containing protein [Chthonomonadales bacterium]